MDKYTKGVLTVIAVALVSITFQLSDTKPIDNAEASMSLSDYNMISNRLRDIASAIRECN